MKEQTVERKKILYQAIVWRQDPNQPGERTTVFAYNLEDAQRQLKEVYGEGISFSLYDEDEANRPRQSKI